MGVPGYFAWLNRKYPRVIRKVRSHGNKRHIDCLYIDVNAICYTYARDETNFAYLLNPKTLEEIYKQIVLHLESMIETAQPQLQVFMMLDGPCPRAKINQQRQRRFKAKMGDDNLQRVLKANGLDVKEPTVAVNSISPGTPFMHELNEQIRAYFAAKIASAPEVCPEGTVNYKKVSIIISDSNCEGEGEHKILEVIHKQENPELTHCIVGADADLILLSMSTIGKRILILRENNRNFRPEKDDLETQVKKLKDSIESKEKLVEQGIITEEAAKLGVTAFSALQAPKVEYEFIDVNALKRVILDRYRKIFENKTVKHLKFNPLSIMDDVVFLSLFVGNDFLPRQQYMKIINAKNQEHILDTFLNKYEIYLEDATTYLSHRGKINYSQIIEFFRVIASIEPEFSVSEVFERKEVTGTKTAADYIRILNPGLSEEELNELVLRNDNEGIVDKFQDKDFLAPQQEEDQEQEVPSPEEDTEDKQEEKPREHKHHDRREKKQQGEEEEECKHDRHEKHGHNDHNNKANHSDKHHHDNNNQGHHDTHDDKPHVEGEKKHFKNNDFDPELTQMMEDHVNGKAIYLKDRMKIRNSEEYDHVIMKYLEGFQFTLMYYFRGIQSSSWDYFYPQYYSPLAQDIVDFLVRNPNFEVKFVHTKPFQPFKQLLAILPPSCSQLLPKSFDGLFEKHLQEYCPAELDVDKYGATAEHMFIVKLPFIDLVPLEKAYNEGEQKLLAEGTEIEKSRNSRSLDILMHYSQEHHVHVASRNKLLVPADIPNAHIKIVEFDHLKATLPQELTKIFIDKEKKEEAKRRYQAYQEKLKTKKQAKKSSNAAEVVAAVEKESQETAEEVVEQQHHSEHGHNHHHQQKHHHNEAE